MVIGAMEITKKICIYLKYRLRNMRENYHKQFNMLRNPLRIKSILTTNLF